MVQDKVDKVAAFIEKDLWSTLKEILNMGIHIGEGEKSIDITVGLLLLVTLSLFATKFFMNQLRKLFTRRMDGEDRLKFITIFKYIRYLIYVVVILLTMSAAGIDITLLITASAALFVGLGLALQDLFLDILSGIMIVVDKSLRVGDVVEIDGRVGRVSQIRLRTTLAQTRDDKVLVIPNHKFMQDLVYNYTQNHKSTRESVKVGVAYGSDVQLVTRLLLQAVEEQKGVLKSPKPFVLFDDFGDSALLFSAHFHITDVFSDPRLKSLIRYRIDALFREHKVTIPFPQRDVHFFAHTPLQVAGDRQNQKQDPDNREG